MVEEDVCVLQVIFTNKFFFCLHSDVPVIREGKYLLKMLHAWKMDLIFTVVLTQTLLL